MRVLWTEPALKDWEESLDYIETENASAAHRVQGRVVDSIAMLALHPFAGRVGKIVGSREFAVPQSPFLIVYEVDLSQDDLLVVAIFDGRRRWPKEFPRE